MATRVISPLYGFGVMPPFISPTEDENEYGMITILEIN